MPAFDLDSFRANFKAGAKSYLFYVKPVFPLTIGANTEQATYLVNTSSLPAGTIEEQETAWQGYTYKVAGKSTFATWTVQYKVDALADIRRWFVGWQTLIHDPTTNIYSAPADYMVDQQVELLGNEGESITKYKLIGAWPSEIGEITLDYTATDLAIFDVTYTYQYHVVDGVSYGKPIAFAG